MRGIYEAPGVRFIKYRDSLVDDPGMKIAYKITRKWNLYIVDYDFAL